MRRILRLVVVAAITITATSAQQNPPQLDADTQKHEQQEQGERGETKGTLPLTTLLKSSLTGCLTQGDEADPYILTVSETGIDITVAGTGDLAKHVGHTVRVRGSMKSDDRYFHATEVVHVAPSCIKGEAKRTDSSAEPAARDKRGGLTADQQSNTASDRKTTQAIRQAIVEDESLSFAAHNVKIITRNGAVTLRGEVRSEQEKASIAAQAALVAGAGKVANELTVNEKGQAEPSRQ